MQHRVPVALTIAGSDCSSGAGIQADLKTFQHFHLHGLTVITCIVSETANIVRAVHAVPVDMVVDQTALMLESFPVAAMKTGMLFSTEHIKAVVEILQKHRDVKLVVDPVMIASTGDPLLEPDAITAYRELLLPLATVITPNLHEAEELLGEKIADQAALEDAAKRLSAQYGTAVLLKGGHLEGDVCTDLLVDGDRVQHFSAPRIPVSGSHGTGCTLSAAITAGLASGMGLAEAVAMAKEYLGHTLLHSYQTTSASGEVIHALNQGTASPFPGIPS